MADRRSRYKASLADARPSENVEDKRGQEPTPDDFLGYMKPKSIPGDSNLMNSNLAKSGGSGDVEFGEGKRMLKQRMMEAALRRYNTGGRDMKRAQEQ